MSTDFITNQSVEILTNLVTLNIDYTRGQSSLEEISLYGWSPVWTQLPRYLITTAFFLSWSNPILLNRRPFVDVEGTKDVKRLITLLAITGQFIPRNRRGSGTQIRPFRKQMLINKHMVNRCKHVNGVFRMFSW